MAKAKTTSKKDHEGVAAPERAATVKLVQVEPPKLAHIRVRLVGITPLLCNNKKAAAGAMVIEDGRPKWTQKGLQKERDPQREYEASLYPIPGGGFGFPAVAIKQAMASGVGKDYGITKGKVYQYVHIYGVKDAPDLVRLVGEPKQHDSIVRQGHAPAMRFRGCFYEWSIDLELDYDTKTFTAETIVNMLARAGLYVGIGDGRPEKKGHNYGRFRVE